MDKPVPAASGYNLAMPKREFIGIAAGLMALNALAIDVMLPAMQQIGAALGVDAENDRQFIVTAYILGFGIAQLFFGPISDRFGRRSPLIIGLLLYLACAFGAAFSPTFTILLALRFLQGVGAAATRVIALSVVRDTFGGRQMAEVMSLVMMIFMIIPIIAPSLGQVVMLAFSWHAIFFLMGGIGLAISIWAYLRLPETLKPENRRAFDPATILDGFRIVLTNRVALCYTIATTFVFSALFGFINSAQQIYVEIYGLGTWFPLLFAAVALLMALSAFLNSRLVGRFGMRRLSHSALLGFLAVNVVLFAMSLAGPMPLVQFVGILGVAMFLFGWIGPNFNALAMEPLGHVAGTASSVLGFTQTFGGGVLGAMIGQAFDGTVRPITAAYCAVSIIALVLVLIGERGRLFRAQNAPA